MAVSRKERLDRLDYYYRAINTTIISRQNPTSGLIPASVAITTHGNYTDAWVRDNVYSIYAVFGLALAYRRVDDDSGRLYELEHSVIKLMRGLLFAMMRQASKVEQFKKTQSLEHSLHAKYDTNTGDTVVGDFEWGHLQIDATSIFLLALAEMTTSGLHIIYTLDEVDFIQNLVFYIENAYRTPDYGIWERGNKINHGQPELNSSSIGMAVAALQCINGVNMFGARGGASSVIHALPDELTRNTITLHSFLPRESNSKEIDAALLSVIGFPAFAVSDPKLVQETRHEIITKLGGKYGCKRFLRDGHQNALEDVTRLHYEPHELQMFEDVESEWPLFFTYLILEGLFTGDHDQVEEYRHKLAPLIVHSSAMDDFAQFLSEPTSPIHPHAPNTPLSGGGGACTPGGTPVRRLSYSPTSSPAELSGHRHEGLELIPELYFVPKDLIDAEKENPHSQPRVANDNVPLVWANSLFFLGRLIHDNLLSPAEIDPLGRRFNPIGKDYRETVVQIVLLTEDEHLQNTLSMFGLETQTIKQISPTFTVLPPDALKEVYAGLGMNGKLNLSGRPKRPIGSLGTSRLYRVQGELYAFTPHFMDNEEFYLNSDADYLISAFESEVAFVQKNWFYPGRPTMVVLLTNDMLGGLTRHQNWNSSGNDASRKNLLNHFMNLRSGRCGGVRIRLGRLAELVNTSNIESLDFLINKSDLEWETILRVANAARYRSSSHRKLGYNERQTQASTPAGYKTPGAKTPKKRSMSFYGKLALTPKPGDEQDSYFSAVTDALKKLNTSIPEDNFKLKSHEDSSSSGTPVRKADVQQEWKATEKIAEKAGFVGKVTPDLSSPISEVNLLPKADSRSDSPSADMLNLTLGDPSQFDQAIDNLVNSVNLYDQVDLLQYLASCRPLNYRIDNLDSTIKELLQEVYYKAVRLQYWSIVRQSAGLLQKVVPSLTVNVTDLVIRQKQVTIGSGTKEYFISMPVGPEVLSRMIEEHCSGDDVREGPLVQEIIIYMGSFIRNNPEIFDGILRLRTHHIIVALREEISCMNKCSEEEAIEYLLQLSPYELQSLLRTILSGPMLSISDTNVLVRDQPGGRLMLSSINGRVRVLPSGSSSDQLSEEKRTMRERSLPIPLSATACSTNPTEVHVKAQSGGFLSGNFSLIELNGNALSAGSRGLNLCVIDPVEKIILERVCFDTHISEDESEDLAKFIDWVDTGMVVIAVVKDDFTEHLTANARAAIESLGSATIQNVKYRDSFALIGVKGADKGTVTEAHKGANDGPTDVIEKRVQLSNVSDEDKEVTAATVASCVPNSAGRWLRRRRNDGALNRMPTDFYPKTWKILERAQGLRINDHVLPREPTVLEKTAEEFNFALMVEHFLRWISDPAERQVAVETLTVISKIQERNPEMKIMDHHIDITLIMNQAIESFWNKWTEKNKDNWEHSKLFSGNFGVESNRLFARKLFFDLPQQDGPESTFSYLAASAFKVLPFEIDFVEDTLK
ncbi:glycosyl hydrolases family 15-domain-containing protein [Umbelopsis sp. PMI_123]|nr:glycosyl hydrolases family 15-domain-containing protein [Umbelopsis sp. PMI_123]